MCVCLGTYITREVCLWQQLTLIESDCIALFGAYDKSVMNKALTMLQLWQQFRRTHVVMTGNSAWHIIKLSGHDLYLFTVYLRS